MRRMLVALALIALAVPAAAQMAPGSQCLAPGDVATRSVLADTAQAPLSHLKERAAVQLSARPLFLDVQDFESTELAVRYSVGDALWLRETISVPEFGGTALVARSCKEVTGESSVERPTRDIPAGTPVVELLASRSDLAERLRAFSDRDPEAVRVEIRAGGALVREASFAELAAASAELSRSPVEALVVRSTVTGPGTHAGTPEPSGANRLGRKLTCEGLCQVEYEDCLANECGTQIYCETCEVEYESCLAACQPPPPPPPPPTCTPKTEYFYDSYLVAYYPSGYSACYYDPWGYYYTVWHDEWVTVVRTDYVKKVTASNCTVTYTLLNYWYTYYYCFDYSFSPCYSYPFYPGALCY